MNINYSFSYFQGACLRYDAEKAILIATPFEGGPKCWNAADWLVILSPFCLIATAISIIILVILDYS